MKLSELENESLMNTAKISEVLKEFGNRLMDLRKEKGLSSEYRTAVVKETALLFKPGDLRELERGVTDLSIFSLYLLAGFFGVNPVWLLTGKGSRKDV